MVRDHDGAVVLFLLLLLLPACSASAAGAGASDCATKHVIKRASRAYGVPCQGTPDEGLSVSTELVSLSTQKCTAHIPLSLCAADSTQLHPDPSFRVSLTSLGPARAPFISSSCHHDHLHQAERRRRGDHHAISLGQGHAVAHAVVRGLGLRFDEGVAERQSERRVVHTATLRVHILHHGRDRRRRPNHCRGILVAGTGVLNSAGREHVARGVGALGEVDLVVRRHCWLSCSERSAEIEMGGARVDEPRT